MLRLGGESLIGMKWLKRLVFKNKLFYILIAILVTAISSYIFLKKDNKDNYWKPNIGDSFQWQLSDLPIDTSIDADIYDLDLFETPKEVIEQLHKGNKKVICYINVGGWEEYREDAESFPIETIGNDYDGWEGEKWLDISNYTKFQDVLISRFDLAVEKGCDGIEPDNIEGYNEDTGFDITYEDQLIFNTWIADEVHKRNMSIGLKNDPEQVLELVDLYDWALLEDCYVWDFCNDYTVFIEQGKPVFQVEYTDNDISLDSFCPNAKDNSYFGLLKNRELDAWWDSCILN